MIPDIGSEIAEIVSIGRCKLVHLGGILFPEDSVVFEQDLITQMVEIGGFLLPGCDMGFVFVPE